MSDLDFFPLPQGPRSLAELGSVGGYPISSYFGGRPNPFTGKPSWHGGEDLVATALTSMIAVLPGYLSQAWDSSGGGWWSTLFADDGRRFGYGHADHYAGLNGQHVDAGTVIAYVDSTGASTGNHLHFAYALSRTGPWQDPFDLLATAAANGRFIGSHTGPLPHPQDVVPLHPEKTPKESLITMQYWKIQGEDPLYLVGVEPFLSPLAVGRDGTPQTAQHFVGGEYRYDFQNPAAFALDAGIGVSPSILDPANNDHLPLIAELRNLPVISQAA